MESTERDRIHPEHVDTSDAEVDGEAYFENLEESDEAFREAWRARVENPRRLFGELILEKRLEFGLSQTALAKAVGTSQNRIYLIETGQTNPTFDTLERLCHALGLRLLVQPDAKGKRGKKKDSGLIIA